MRRAFMACCALLFAFSLLFVTPHFAFASGGPNPPGKPTDTTNTGKVSPLTSTCFSSPSDAHCDNVDPSVSNCSSSAGGAYTVASAVFLEKRVVGGTLNTTILTVDLRYSTVCKSNWARVTVISGGTVVEDTSQGYMYIFNAKSIRITRDDGLSYSYTVTELGYSVLYSSMVYSPVRKAQACAQIYINERTLATGELITDVDDEWYCTAFY